jgi:hypothetical protein
MTEPEKTAAPTIVVDPALTDARYPVIEGNRYFGADDGDVDYTIVARDLDHAKEILRASGMEFGDPSLPFDQADLTWHEVSRERAARIRVHDDDRRGGVHALDTYPAGEWCCSEW